MSITKESELIGMKKVSDIAAGLAVNLEVRISFINLY
jgi:hypothetical protein